jgi:hypothetical protein
MLDMPNELTALLLQRTSKTAAGSSLDRRKCLQASLASTIDRLSAHEPNRAEGMTEPEIAGTALPTVDQTQVTDVTT